jgi:hypothetical protein
MRPFLMTLGLLSLIFGISCKKTSKGPLDNLALMQHTWMVVSENGEAFRYIGVPADYYNFSTDGFLYRYLGNRHDTSAYTLESDNRTLLLFPIVNGVKSSISSDFTIRVLTNTQFIFGDLNAIFHSIDSLKR